jgi:uncharacterized coiled-coil protein SlyX
MDQRLVDLEIRYTHLEKQVEELSQVVFEQQLLLGRMGKDLLALRARLASTDEGAPDERPPHY